MNILEVEHLTRVYGSGDTAVTALDDVSFSVEAGEFIAIIGSSGSGKSTLMHLMGGVDRPPPAPSSCRGRTSSPVAMSSWPYSVVGRWDWSTSSTISFPYSM